jgi:ubiquinone/menaquinone biosynthesis C-methylase UbiE
MQPNNSSVPRLSNKIREHYAKEADEQSRLEKYGQLEFHRTKEIIARHLPRRSAVILDVGGGPGHYSCWLAKLGHKVHLVDPVPLHVEQAKAAAASRRRMLASAALGDARKLNFAERFADVVLLLGPLYHLVHPRDRATALAEACRTLKPGGLLFAAAISRFASAFDGLFRGFVNDPRFFRIVRRDLKSGQHRNLTNNPQYFTTAFFHHPNQLHDEVQAAGFAQVRVHGLEGPGWLLPAFEKYWKEPRLRGKLLTIVRAMETEPTLLGQSAHLLVVARKR